MLTTTLPCRVVLQTYDERLQPVFRLFRTREARNINSVLSGLAHHIGSDLRSFGAGADRLSCRVKIDVSSLNSGLSERRAGWIALEVELGVNNAGSCN